MQEIKGISELWFCPLGEHYVSREEYNITRGICHKHDRSKR